MGFYNYNEIENLEVRRSSSVFQVGPKSNDKGHTEKTDKSRGGNVTLEADCGGQTMEEE